MDSSVFNPTEYDRRSEVPTTGSKQYAELIVVRHGETLCNAEGIIQGQLDVDLSEVGKQQVIAVADRLSKEFKITAIYSSDLKRALDTARPIASACGGLEVIEDKCLRERHLGDLQGLARAKLALLAPKAYPAFISRQTNEEIPGGGESIDQLYGRSTTFLEAVARKHIGEKVIVVTHGGVINCLCKRAGAEGGRGKAFNTSVSIFQVSDGGEWTVKMWCDVSHLNTSQYLNSAFGATLTSA